MRVPSLIFAALIALLPAPTFANTNAPAPPDEIRRALAAYAKGHPKVMIALGMISQGKTRNYFVRGTQVASTSLDERTLFEIGSVTKTFTATLLAQMVQSGDVSLNDPIQRYLAPGIVTPTYSGIPITLASLAEHRSGLPTDPPNLPSRDPSHPFAGYTIDMLYGALDHYKLTRAPGAQYEYSNFGFGLLGQLLANRAHAPYAALVEQRILQPLGMKDTVVVGSPITSRRLAPAFTYGGQPVGPWDDLGALNPAGSIESNLHDMVIYLRANMNAPAGPLGKEMFFAQQPRASEEPADKDYSQGLAWETSLQYGFVDKAGGTAGYSASIVFNRRVPYGMVFLANSPNNSDLTQLAQHLITPANVSAPTEWSLIKKESSPYGGRYPIVVPKAAPLMLTIFKYHGQLYIQIPQFAPERLAKLKGGRYSWQSQNVIITFMNDLRGRVTGLTASQNGHITTAKKQP